MELKQSGSPPAVDAPPTGRPRCSQRSAVFSKPTVPACRRLQFPRARRAEVLQRRKSDERARSALSVANLHLRGGAAGAITRYAGPTRSKAYGTHAKD